MDLGQWGAGLAWAPAPGASGSKPKPERLRGKFRHVPGLPARDCPEKSRLRLRASPAWPLHPQTPPAFPFSTTSMLVTSQHAEPQVLGPRGSSAAPDSASWHNGQRGVQQAWGGRDALRGGGDPRHPLPGLLACPPTGRSCCPSTPPCGGRCLLPCFTARWGSPAQDAPLCRFLSLPHNGKPWPQSGRRILQTCGPTMSLLGQREHRDPATGEREPVPSPDHPPSRAGRSHPCGAGEEPSTWCPFTSTISWDMTRCLGWVCPSLGCCSSGAHEPSCLQPALQDQREITRQHDGCFPSLRVPKSDL